MSTEHETELYNLQMAITEYWFQLAKKEKDQSLLYHIKHTDAAGLLKDLFDSHSRLRTDMIDYQTHKNEMWQKAYQDAHEEHTQELSKQQALKVLGKMTLNDIIDEFGHD